MGSVRLGAITRELCGTLLCRLDGPKLGPFGDAIKRPSKAAEESPLALARPNVY